jgi:hypothetical protein
MPLSIFATGPAAAAEVTPNASAANITADRTFHLPMVAGLLPV